ncbi:hypothetical protein D3C87_1662640 [compost metagenome]
MVGLGDVFLHFEELRGVDRHIGVFLGVDCLGFQRREHFAKGHRRRVGAQVLEGVEEHVVLHDANLHAFEVFPLRDRTNRVRQVAEAVFPIGEVDEAGGLHLLVHHVAELAVENLVGFVSAGKQEGQVEHAESRVDADQRRGRGDDGFLDA